MTTLNFIKKNLFKAFMASAVCLSFSSCLDDDNSYVNMYPNAIVTVKSEVDKTCFLQLDEKTTLLPVNLSESPFGEKEVRALVNYSESEESSGKYSKAVHVNWIDSVLTKNIAPDLRDKNDEVYGNDPVEILNDWVTVAEDGYLTLRFATRWGYAGVKHYVNLLSTNNPNNPYELEFRHNAYEDKYGDLVSSIVAFKLDKLPDTQGKTVKLKLNWISFSGRKSYEFDYYTRKATNPQSKAVTSVQNVMEIK